MPKLSPLVSRSSVRARTASAQTTSIRSFSLVLFCIIGGLRELCAELVETTSFRRPGTFPFRQGFTDCAITSSRTSPGQGYDRSNSRFFQADIRSFFQPRLLSGPCLPKNFIFTGATITAKQPYL
jgi:hypothetical protein